MLAIAYRVKLPVAEKEREGERKRDTEKYKNSRCGESVCESSAENLFAKLWTAIGNGSFAA